MPSITVQLPEGVAIHVIPAPAGTAPQISFDFGTAVQANQGHQPARGDIEAALAATYASPSAEAATAAIEAGFQLGFVVLSITTQGRVPPVPPITNRPPSLAEITTILDAALSIDHPASHAAPEAFLAALLASVNSHG